jgi:hypothetical protein
MKANHWFVAFYVAFIASLAWGVYGTIGMPPMALVPVLSVALIGISAILVGMWRSGF